MMREPRLLRHYADMVTADLNHTLDGEWTCTVTDELELRVTGATWQGLVEMDTAVDLDEEIDEDEVIDEEYALEVDASRSVVEQTIELLGNAQIIWPRCATHDRQLEVIDELWICADEAHDMGTLGHLGRS